MEPSCLFTAISLAFHKLVVAVTSEFFTQLHHFNPRICHWWHIGVHQITVEFHLTNSINDTEKVHDTEKVPISHKQKRQTFTSYQVTGESEWPLGDLHLHVLVPCPAAFCRLRPASLGLLRSEAGSRKHTQCSKNIQPDNYNVCGEN